MKTVDVDVIAKVNQTIDVLCERFPRTFFQYEKRRVLLKVHIDQDIRAALSGEVDDKDLGAALRFYCGNLHYLRLQHAGAPRFDLDGNQSGEVSKLQAKNAAAGAALLEKQQRAAQRTAAPPPKRGDGLAALRAAAQARRRHPIKEKSEGPS